MEVTYTMGSRQVKVILLNEGETVNTLKNIISLIRKALF